MTIPANTTSLALSDATSLDDWLAIGRTLADQSRTLPWLVGDWYAFGKDRFADQLDLALPTITDDPKSLERAATVAKAFPPALRDMGLSFAHYEHLASLPHGEARRLLADAKERHLTPRETRIEAVKAKAEVQQSCAFKDDDWAHFELVAIARAWNRARLEVRAEFLEMANDCDMGIIEP